MARKSSWNPIAFVPAQVTIISTAVYIALFSILIYIHNNVPALPSSPTPANGINLTTAWLDLEEISSQYHPFNSRRNVEVKEYMLEKVLDVARGLKKDGREGDITIWDGADENVTFVDTWSQKPYTLYVENENIVIYIRGTDDEPGPWWTSHEPYKGPKGGVLLNAHYDSVSTGFGATDDGVGVVTVLQLISYFTHPDHKPKRGIIALLNNGEEDGLYGAHAYVKHPSASFPRTFLNLEGAGAGGRAALFRSTDAEVTKFYASAPHPFGTVVSGDGFKRGFVRSGTDYSVFNGELGLRGLDVAFMAPRARYHTDQDDARDTSPESVWHMLSSSLETMKAMTEYDGDEFSGGKRERSGKNRYGKGSDGVWFDLLGLTFAVLKLSDLFAISVTLLTAAPILLIVVQVIITKSDKWYPFSRKQYLHNADDDEPVYFNGFRGFFRFPLAFVVATAGVVALAYLQTKINPYIVYSSEYAVWAMMLGAWFGIAWFLLTMADRVRPTALSRFYTLLWMYSFSWLAMVLTTISENNMKVASGYFIVIYNGSIFVALLISYLELLGLPKHKVFVEHVVDVASPQSTRPGSVSSRRLLDHSEDLPRINEDDEDAHERTGLLRGGDSRTQNTFSNFGRGRNRDVNKPLDENDDIYLAKAYGDEQAWSGSLPQWTWILQFLILAVLNTIVIGQIALFTTSALHQTPADGNSVFPIYLIMAVLSILLLLPLTPFLHRFTFHFPTLFFLIFIGCLVYNLLAFPFSRDARLKTYFIQTMDLDTGINQVILTGLDGYIQDIIAELPSAAGQKLNCTETSLSLRTGLRSCSWTGLTPNVVPEATSKHALAPYGNHTHSSYKDWVSYSISTPNTTHNSALFTLRGLNSRACRLTFTSPVSGVHISNITFSSTPTVAPNGSTEVRLFGREFGGQFEVNVTWADGKSKGKKGKVGCLWSDGNGVGEVPALDEIKRFAPVWSSVTKGDVGLVEGWKEWKI
ncbi:hypothetical protein B0A48_13574 [Cryoendolithus antarcticus]|uniref:Peptide hydrolase n=1 Tax=Cryoendolithus antarcticus TaxID=1507870 RepID=A0A1V8SNZ2_9PEZI|nr:hypothetical protein B0A48_13574 [Cryoendolithus antarcticus]